MAELLPTSLFAFFLVFARVGTALMVMPGFGEVYVFPRARLTIALALSLVVTPLVLSRMPPAPASAWMLFVLIAGEILIGAFIGFIGRMILAALGMAGMVIAYQSSLANAFVYDPVAAQQGALAGAFLTITGVLLIFVTDAHHLMLSGLVESYSVFRPGTLPPVGDLSEAMARLMGESFLLAMQIAAPFLVVGLLFTLGVGLLNRLMPQVQMFFVAMPMQILLGGVILMLTISAIMLWFLDRFDAAYRGVLFSG